jgi:hypothetical protein
MADDRNIKISITTTADTTGAKESGVSIEELKKTVQVFDATQKKAADSTRVLAEESKALDKTVSGSVPTYANAAAEVEALEEAMTDESRAAEKMAAALAPITEAEEELAIAQARRKAELAARTKPAIDAIKEETNAEERLEKQVLKTAVARNKAAEAQVKQTLASKAKAKPKTSTTNPIMRMGRGESVMMLARQMIVDMAKTIDDAYSAAELHGTMFADAQTKAFRAVVSSMEHPIDAILNLTSGGVFQQLKDLPKDLARAEKEADEIMQRIHQNRVMALEREVTAEKQLLELQFRRLDAVREMNQILGIKESNQPDFSRANKDIQLAGVDESAARKLFEDAQKSRDEKSKLPIVFAPGDSESNKERIQKNRDALAKAEADLAKAKDNLEKAEQRTIFLENQAEVDRGPAVGRAYDRESQTTIETVQKVLEAIGDKYAGQTNSAPGQAVDALRNIISDGKITDAEMPQLLEAMRTLNDKFFASSAAQRDAMNALIREVDTLKSFYSEMKAYLNAPRQ